MPFPASCCLVVVVASSSLLAALLRGLDPGITGGCYGHLRGCSTRRCCSTAASGVQGMWLCGCACAHLAKDAQQAPGTVLETATTWLLMVHSVRLHCVLQNSIVSPSWWLYTLNRSAFFSRQFLNHVCCCLNPFQFFAICSVPKQTKCSRCKICCDTEARVW